MKARTLTVEFYFTPAQVALMLQMHRETVLTLIKQKAFGTGVLNVGNGMRPDYRVPSSGLNSFKLGRHVFELTPIEAGSEAELRRKIKAA